LQSSISDPWETIALGAAEESPLWGEALRPDAERELRAVFSPLAKGRYALGIETIYEGYLLHYGRPRLFEPSDADTRLLLGDYLYAHGLQRVTALSDLAAVADLAELISVCAQVRAEGGDGDGEAWAATAAALGSNDGLATARAVLRDTGDAAALAALARGAVGAEPVERALAAHRERLR
jgi:hypothetical protein